MECSFEVEWPNVAFNPTESFPTTETGSPPPAQLVFNGASRAHVFYNPSIEEQKSLGGLNADFVIKYNVILTDLIGDVQVLKNSIPSHWFVIKLYFSIF